MSTEVADPVPPPGICAAPARPAAAGRCSSRVAADRLRERQGRRGAEGCPREGWRLPTDAARAALLPDRPRLTPRRPTRLDPAPSRSLHVADTQIRIRRAAAGSSALVSSLARGVGRAIPTMDRRAFLRRSGLGVGVGLAASQLTLVRKAQAADGAKAAAGAKVQVEAHGLRPLLGRLRRRRGGRERRLGAPGAGVRFADQPRRALRQGRRAARARPWRVPPEVRR